MTAAHQRGARAETRAAKALGVKRVHRQRGESAPDLTPAKTSSGALLGAEVKARAGGLPRLITESLKQAERYWRGRAIPLVVVFRKGERRGIVALDLDSFACLVGLDVAALPAPRPLRRVREPAQLGLPGVA